MNRIFIALAITISLMMTKPIQADTLDTLTSHIEKIKDVFGPAKQTYDTIDSIISLFKESEPDVAELIEQFKDEVLNEIRTERDRRWAAAISGLLDRYLQDILRSPVPHSENSWIVKLDDWLADAADTNAQLRDIIMNSTHESADFYRLTKAYNTIVIPYVSVMRMRGYTNADIRNYIKT